MGNSIDFTMRTKQMNLFKADVFANKKQVINKPMCELRLRYLDTVMGKQTSHTE